MEFIEKINGSINGSIKASVSGEIKIELTEEKKTNTENKGIEMVRIDPHEAIENLMKKIFDFITYWKEASHNLRKIDTYYAVFGFQDKGSFFLLHSFRGFVEYGKKLFFIYGLHQIVQRRYVIPLGHKFRVSCDKDDLDDTVFPPYRFCKFHAVHPGHFDIKK